MSKHRTRSLISIGVLCALIASAVFASSAMAEVREWGHEENHWQVDGATLNKGEAQPLELLGLGEYEGSESMDFVWHITGLEESISFSCSKAEVEAELFGPASGEASLTLDGCTMQGSLASVCSIENEEIQFTTLEFNLSGDTATFSPLAAENLFVLHVGGPSCPGLVSGNHPVKGSFSASLGAEGETVMNLLPIESSAMTIAGNPVTMRGSLPAKLSGGPEWNVEGIGQLSPGEAESLGCAVGEYNEMKELVLSGEVGSTKIPTTITATGAECVETSISNEGEVGVGAGKLKLTGVSVSEPSGCSVEGGTIESKPLRNKLQSDFANPEKVLEKFEPASGYVNLAVVHIVGAECPVTGPRPLKGSFYGEATNHLGVKSRTHPFNFSAASEEAATGEINLQFASNPAELTGQMINFLSGASAGSKFWMR